MADAAWEPNCGLSVFVVLAAHFTPQQFNYKLLFALTDVIDDFNTDDFDGDY